MKHSDEKSRLIFLVNRAQAYKWDGQLRGHSRSVASQDWTATGTAFQLAEAVLRDKHGEAIELMSLSVQTVTRARRHTRRGRFLEKSGRLRNSARLLKRYSGSPLEKLRPQRKNPRNLMLVRRKAIPDRHRQLTRGWRPHREAKGGGTAHSSFATPLSSHR